VTPQARVERVGRPESADLDGLAALLIDVVDGDASVGFHAPLPLRAAQGYWREVIALLDDDVALWLAREPAAPHRIVGAVQMQRAGRENGRHRAEVCKLLVLHAARRSGIASQLMAALEDHARALGLTLLVLDTEAQSPAESFYRHHGWQRVGEIPGYASRGDGSLLATALHFKAL
jgi:acetyltransferase